MGLRLRLFFALCCLAVSGCQVGVITAPGVDPTDPPDDDDPEARFLTEVQPLLDQRCASCHTDAASAPVFMDPGDEYRSVLSYPDLVAPGDPSASTLLTKGNHDGPAWSGDQASTIAAWIEMEGEVDPIDPPPTGGLESMEITVRPGMVNRIPLDSLGMTGSSIQFSASQVALGMHLTEVELVAGSGGAAISSPRFVMHPATGAAVLDDDRFSTTQLRVSSGMSAELTSALLLVDYPADGTLSVQFDSAGTID